MHSLELELGNKDNERRNNMNGEEREMYLENMRNRDNERRNNMNGEERETYLEEYHKIL